MTKLKTKRLEAGLTQLQLAKQTGINIRVLQHYEQGSKKFDHARIDKILNVCIALNCKLQDIMEDQNFIELVNKYKKI